MKNPAASGGQAPVTGRIGWKPSIRRFEKENHNADFFNVKSTVWQILADDSVFPFSFSKPVSELLHPIRPVKGWDFLSIASVPVFGRKRQMPLESVNEENL